MAITVEYTDGTKVKFDTVAEWAEYATKHRHRIRQTEAKPTVLVKTKRKKEVQKKSLGDVGMEATINRAVKRKRVKP